MVVEVTRNGAVLELVLDRPDALNAFTTDMHRELAAALKDARDDDVRAVVITGSGRAFCAGQDLEETLTQETTPGERLQRFYNPNILAIRSLEKPVIAAVNGVAAGAGIALALACDIRIASEKASFVPAFVAIGLVPDSGLSWFAVQAIGYPRAFDWITSNRKLTAQEALQLGLVGEVVGVEEVRQRAHERAEALASAPGDAIAMTKRLLSAASTAALDEQLERERQLQQAASEHPAYAQQVDAFVNKQTARA